MNKKPKLWLMLALLFVAFTTGFLTSRFPINFLGLTPPVPKLKINDGSEYSFRHPAKIDLASLFPKLIVRQGTPRGTALALTFDDGPDMMYTSQILDVLKKYNVKATFFVVGTQIQKYPYIFKRIIREGHAIGNHGFHHLDFTKQSAATQRYLLSKNEKIIKTFGGISTNLFRPPYGALNPNSVQIIGKQGYKIILWTIDTLDWRGLKKDQVLTNVLPNLHRGYIILQHCAAQLKKEDLTGTIDALPWIIKTAKIRGYHFVTIPKLLQEINH